MGFYSDNGIDIKVAEIFGDFVGHACDVGANDGTQLSNSLHFEEKGWTVLCVEPNPLLAEEGRKTRKLWREVACANKDSEEREFELRSKGNKWASSTSFKSETKPGSEGYDFDRAVMVKVRTLDRLLEEAGFPKLDFLTVDVEGWEKEVMAGFTVERWKPRVICLEAWDDNYKIEIPGYDIIERSQMDNLYVRRES